MHQWVAELKERTDEGAMMVLVANKSDLNEQREVSMEEGMTLASKLEIEYI